MGAIVFLFVLLLCVGIYIGVCWLCFAKIFEKAGYNPKFSLIPVYNQFLLVKITGASIVWFILMLIPYVNFVAMIYVYYRLAKAFGKGIGYTIGLIFLSIIFLPVLGFGSAEYQLEKHQD